MNLRIGQGFDLHRLVPGAPLVIGGIAIPSEKGSLAHSDGDALLHALIDSLLGSVGLGDIGELFPPSDEKFKDADSQWLLTQALEVIRKQWPNFRVENVDATVILEKPHLKAYKIPIRDQIAELLGIRRTQVSIKAKTAEGLGAFGSGDAIAAQVVILVNAE